MLSAKGTLALCWVGVCAGFVAYHFGRLVWEGLVR